MLVAIRSVTADAKLTQDEVRGTVAMMVRGAFDLTDRDEETGKPLPALEQTGATRG